MKQPAHEVAEAGYKALMDDDSHVVSGLNNKIQTAIGEILPETLKAKREYARQSLIPKQPGNKKEKT
jgi:hypothetical protein